MYRDPAAGPQHLAPDQVYQLTIHLGDIHHTFTAGNRLQVDITSSNFPRRVRNTNSGNATLADDTAADIHIATNAVHHSEHQPSFIVLPVLRV
jgi:predicted acyl esterase